MPRRISFPKPLPGPRPERPVIDLIVPEGFEDIATVEKMRRHVVDAILKHPQTQLSNEAAKIASCDANAPCTSGLCPSCCRRYREELISFALRFQLKKSNWWFVTIRVPGWTKQPGDFTRFGPLGSNLQIAQFKQLLRRAKEKDTSTDSPLLVIGAIETVWKSIANQPAEKAFHLHLLICGTSKTVILKEAKAAFLIGTIGKLSCKSPITCTRVGPGWSNFCRALSYCWKQPYWAKSFVDPEDRYGRLQTPKPGQLAELAANLGAHQCNDRTILIGVKCQRNVWRLSTPEINAKLFKPHQSQRQVKRCPGSPKQRHQTG